MLKAKYELENQGDNDDKSDPGDNLPDDRDDIDEAAEYELWKIRELKRIKSDREERVRIEEEKREVERRRNLTEGERVLENIRLGSDSTEVREKSKYRFMQKYYHSGAFYQDNKDELLNRDYNIAVGEDLYEKSIMPTLKHKRRGEYGKKG